MEQVTKQSLEDINLGELRVNQAFLNITSHHSAKLWMYTLSEDCVRCPFTKFREIAALNQQLLRFDASRSLEWKFFDEDHGQYAFGDETTFCEVKPTNIGPRGVYNIDVHTGHCSYDVRLDPVNYNLSVLYALLILAAVLAVLYTGSFIYRRFKRTRKSAAVESGVVRSEVAVESGVVESGDVKSGIVEAGDVKSGIVESEVVESGDVKSGVVEPVVVKPEIIESEKPKPTKTRVRSLDVFRGVAIVVMIFVNSGGGSVWWMEHATWNGLYVADLVFPWFLWIMGVCIPISIKSQMSRRVSKAKVLYTILIRSIKLFFIGFCLNTRGGSFEEVRIMGVLQRFGISYFIVASIHVLVYVEPKDILPEGKLRRALYDIQLLAFQWFLILCITAMHLVITFGLEVPGCPRGYLGPGGKQDNATNVNCIGGATGYVDELILGSKHIYRWPTAGTVYDASAFDPEGMVGCLTTFLQVFIGLQCGITLMVYTCWKDRVSRLLIWGIVLGVIGGGLCQFSQDDGVIPVNKNLWSLSFVFVTSALAYLLLTLFYVLVDVLKWWSGTPLVYAGMNAILLYVGHSVIGSMFPWRWSIGPMNTHLVLLVENMWHAGMWVVVSYYFYCKKIFISV